jgi:hypothetical protein
MAQPDPNTTKPPRPPDKPDPWECCNRGCCPCIMDYYDDALERWKVNVRKLGFDPDKVLKGYDTRPGKKR